MVNYALSRVRILVRYAHLLSSPPVSIFTKSGKPEKRKREIKEPIPLTSPPLPPVETPYPLSLHAEAAPRHELTIHVGRLLCSLRRTAHSTAPGIVVSLNLGSGGRV